MSLRERPCQCEAQASPQAPQQADNRSSALYLTVTGSHRICIATCAAANLICIGLVTAFIITRLSSPMNDCAAGPVHLGQLSTAIAAREIPFTLLITASTTSVHQVHTDLADQNYIKV